MSVRKAESRTSSREGSGGVQALKSLGFWALLAGASFIVGLFILSPLINVAAGSHSTANNSAPRINAPALQPSNQPSTMIQTPASQPERHVDSDVGISVERPKPAGNPEVQRSVGVEETATTPPTDMQLDEDRRAGHRRRTEELGGDGTPSSSRESDNTGHIRVEDSAGPNRGDRSIEPQPSDSVERASRGDRAMRNRATESEPAGSRSGSRSGRTRSDNDSGSREKPSPPVDVQKGESIDR